MKTNKTTISIMMIMAASAIYAGAGILEPLATINGPIAYFGKKVVGGADLNGGGVPDIAVGSYVDNEGRVYVYFGESFDTIPDLVFRGENLIDYFGDAIAFCPDINGDSRPELVVGARNYMFGSGIGRVYVFFGGASMDTTADIVFSNPTGAGEQFGYAVACGNLTGGSSPDIAVSAPYYYDGANFVGRVYLFTDMTASGPADTLYFDGAAGSDEISAKRLAIGKMDGNVDTYDDLLVGAPDANSYDGKAYLYYGGAVMNTVPDLTWNGGTGTAEMFGASMAGVGDLDHDGRNDFAIGIPQRNSSRGSCYIVLGKIPQDTTPDYVLHGAGDGDYFGSAVNSAGDVNGDTYSDLIISARSYNGGIGRVFVYATEFDTVYDAYADAPDPYNNFGSAVTACGDLNGDTYGDVIIGCEGGTGRVYLYQGRADLNSPSITNVTQITDTTFTGPFKISAQITDNSGINSDSIYYDINGSGYTAAGHDSTNGTTYFFHIPQQAPPAYVPIGVSWYLMARDQADPEYNVAYSPEQGSVAPYSFEILDKAGPAITNTTVWPDTSFLGPYQVFCDVSDQSGISLVRLAYWESSGQTNILPMYPTGTPGQYYASIPVQNSNRVIAYRVEAKDSFIEPNMGYDPQDYPTGFAFIIGSIGPQLLLVDNDAGDTIETFYKKTLDSLQLTYFLWPDAWGSPRNLLADNFPVVIWFTAKKKTNILVPNDMDSLTAFFDRGGRMFMSSQNLGYDIGATSFYQNYLHAQFNTDSSTEFRAIAVPGDSVGDIYKDTIQIGGNSGANNANSIDRIFPNAGADSVYRFRQIGGSAAIKYKNDVSGHRLVYFAFPWEAINGPAVLYAQRGPVMASVLRWLGVIPAVEENNDQAPGFVFALHQVKPNPFSDRTMIRYSTPASDNVSFKIYDLGGRLVKTIHAGKIEAGSYSYQWTGQDNARRDVPSGVYFLVLEDAQTRLKQKIVLAR